jgi:CSLREA domain-containing protein
MQTTHTHTRLGAQRKKLALALSLTLFITALGYLGATGGAAQAAGARLGQWLEHDARAALATWAVRGAASATLFATITVNTTADDNVVNGNCTLREAIIAANTNAAVDACTAGAAGLDTIQFNIGAGTPSIAIMGLALPTIIQPVIINGNTGGATRVELNGAAAGAAAHGLTITAGGSRIQALVINRFNESGIAISGAGGNTVVNCFIGTDFTGTADLGNLGNGVSISGAPTNIIGGTMAGERNIISGNNKNGIAIANAGAIGNQVLGNYIGTDVNGASALRNEMAGIFLDNASNNTIGGTAAGAGNLISGHSHPFYAGIVLQGVGTTFNLVAGNYIGTDVNGASALPNVYGVVIDLGASNNTIGGTTAGARNIISGNTSLGIFLNAAGTTLNQVVGNYIGTDVNGASAVPNESFGIVIQVGARNNTIGGTAAGARNIISGNKSGGLLISFSLSDGNLVQGNYIGVAADGTTPLGNVAGSSGFPFDGSGVTIHNAPGNTIGGTAAGAANLIANNAAAGVTVIADSFNSPTTLNNRILSNSIFANNGLGIDLGSNGVTSNDAGDPDIGVNNRQNFPVLTSVSPAGVVTGTLDSLPANTAYPVRLEFFANTGCDPSGNGEGEVFLGSISVNAPGNFATGAFAIPAGKPFVTATATDNNGNTSEFSQCAQNVNVNLYTSTLTDPLACTGPGSLVTGTIQLGNPAAVTQAFTLTTTFTNLAGVPNSCTLTGAAAGATCTVTAGGLTASGNLPANTTLTVQYQAQVADVSGSTTVTASNTATLGGATVLPDPLVSTRTINCPAVGPGLAYPATGEASDQKPGSVLVYNLYSSSIAAPSAQNTRIAITNTHPQLPIAVHLFFVDGATCSIADSMICLTPNQTASFLASDIDPGTTGYIVAVASNLVTGCPVSFNYLIGDEYVKLSSGHAANLSAEAFAALAGGLPACDATSVTAVLNFDGMSYNRAPRVLAASNIPSRADGNDTLIVLNRLGGSLVTGAATLGSLFGILYDDAENPLSFTFTAGTCQFRSSLSSNFPRLAPRFEQFIPAGRSGWAKFYSTADIALLGAQINSNANAETAANAFNQGHNLHKLTLTQSVQLTIPIFPPNC